MKKRYIGSVKVLLSSKSNEQCEIVSSIGRSEIIICGFNYPANCCQKNLLKGDDARCGVEKSHMRGRITASQPSSARQDVCRCDVRYLMICKHCQVEGHAHDQKPWQQE